MTSIGTGYDLSNSVFSPDGRNFQVEYAVKAVENGGTAIGIRCKDGVVLAVEKIISSKLLKPGANKRIAKVDRNIGIVSAGLVPDGRHFVSRARDEASSWRSTYKGKLPTSVLASRLGGYVQAYTCIRVFDRSVSQRLSEVGIPNPNCPWMGRSARDRNPAREGGLKERRLEDRAYT